MPRAPISCTSFATATLDTVARPMWLSGIRKPSATALITPIWCRTFFRSGRVGGSTSQISSNPGTPGTLPKLVPQELLFGLVRAQGQAAT